MGQTLCPKVHKDEANPNMEWRNDLNAFQKDWLELSKTEESENPREKITPNSVKLLKAN